MAVCEIWDVRGRLDHPIDYAENPEKMCIRDSSRTRRKLQARYPELAGSRPVRKKRSTGEHDYRRYAKE